LAFIKRSYKKPDEIKDDLKKAFQIFDINGDGYISREELREVLTKMGESMTEQEVDEMMEKADKNGDGKIDYDGVCNFHFTLRIRILLYITVKLSIILIIGPKLKYCLFPLSDPAI
jgi:hypothetical protein